MSYVTAVCTALVRLLRPTRGIHTTPSGYLRELGAELLRCRSTRVRRYAFDIPRVLAPDPVRRPASGPGRRPTPCPEPPPVPWKHEYRDGTEPDEPSPAVPSPGVPSPAAPAPRVPTPRVPAPRRPSGADPSGPVASRPDASQEPGAPGKPGALPAPRTTDAATARRTRHYDPDDLVRSYLRAHERHAARRSGRLDEFVDAGQGTAQARGCAV